MTVSFRGNGAAALAAAAFILAATLMPAAELSAQGANSPTAQPWDDRVKRFYGRGEPDREFDRAKRKLFGDPLHDRMGLPENRLNDPDVPDGTQSTAPPAFDQRTLELDRDRDGAISREEYFQGKTRNVTPGFRGERRHQRVLDRLDTQFRKADRDRDGKVTPAELQGPRRF